jgi:hypothetical protein
VLAEELLSRAATDRETNKRRATTLVLQHRGERKVDHKEKWIAGKVNELTGTLHVFVFLAILHPLLLTQLSVMLVVHARSNAQQGTSPLIT